MKLLEKLRSDRGYSQRALGKAASVPHSYINRAEKSIVLYPEQLGRIAEALGYEGDPSDLLKDVEG